MPNEIEVARLVASIDANTDGLEEGVKQSEKSLQKLNKALVDNQYKQKDCNKTISDARRELKNIEKEIGENKKANEDQKKRIEELNNTIEDEKLKLSKLKTEQAGLRQVISETSKEILNNNNQWTILKGTLANLASDGLQKVGSKLLEIGRGIIQTGEQFTASMSEVQAISGATGEQLKQLEEAARLYGSTTKFSANEAADALKYMALAGWDAQTSISALPGVLDLAAASGMGLAQASDMVTDYLSAFGMEASQASYFSDLLTYAQGNSNTSAEQLGEAYRNCAANLNAAGQDIETVTSMLEAMANQGLKGSQSGTVLTAVMRDITSKMEDGAVKIGNVSVAVQDAEGNFRDLTDIMTDVSKAVDGMGTATRATALSSVFTEESIKGVNLILNEGVDKIADYESALRSSTGAASEAAKVMNDNLSGDIKNMQSAFDELKLKIYEGAESPLRSLVQTITKSGVPALESIIDNLDKVIPVIVGAATAMGTMKASLAIGKLIYDLSGGMKNLTFTTQAQTVATQAQTVATEAQTVATEGATVATHGLNAAMAANVIGLVLSGVMALVSALGSYAIMSGSASEATENYTDCLEELNKANETAKENMASAKEEAANIQALAAEYDELRNQASLTAGEKERLDGIASQLADTLGTTTEALKDKNGAYMDISSSIDDYIDKLIEQAEYEAYADKIRAAAVDRMNAEDSLKAAQKRRDDAQKALDDSGLQQLANAAEENGYTLGGRQKEELQELKGALEQAEKEVHKFEVAYGYANAELEVAQEKIKELGNATDDTSDSTLSAEEATENYNKKLNEYEDLLTNADDALKNTTDEQSSLKQELTDANKALDENKKLIKDETENLKKLIDEQSKCNTETEDGKNKYKDLQEKIDKSSSTLSVYIDKQKELGQNVSNVKTKIEQAAEASKTLDEKLAELSKQSNSLRSEMNSLASSVKQLEKGEALSLDTILSLIEKYPEYTDQLVSAAGNADLQKKALEALFNAKKNEYLLAQQAAIDKIKASNEETKAVVKNVEMQIRVYEMLGGIVGAVATASAIANIALLNTQISEAERQIAALEKRKAFAESLSAGSFSNNNSASSSSSSKSSGGSSGASKSTTTYTTSGRGVNGVEGNSYAQSRMKWIERVRNLEKMTLSEEIKELETLRRRTDLTYEEMYEIDLKLYKDRQKLLEEDKSSRQSALQAEYDRIDKLVKRNLISAREEIRLLENIAKKYKLTTEQKIALEEKLYEKKQQLRDKEISALDKLGDAVVTALKNKYEQQKQLEEKRIDESIESWKKWEDSTVNAIQGQIDALDELKKTHEEENAREEYEHKRQVLELQKRYEKDDFNRKQIQKQIAALDKEENERLANLEIEERKKALQEQQEAVRKLSSDNQTRLENGKSDISAKYDKYLNDFALQGEARNFILNNSSSQITSLINRYASDYEMLGTSLGESLYQGISKKVDNIIKYVDNITLATDTMSEKAKAAFELKNNSASVQRQADYLQKLIPSASSSAQKINSVINDFASKIDYFSSGVSAYKQRLAVTANAAADKYYRTKNQYYSNTNSTKNDSKTVNVYLTANFNDKVDSPVKVKRQLESFGYEIAKQI